MDVETGMLLAVPLGFGRKSGFLGSPERRFLAASPERWWGTTSLLVFVGSPEGRFLAASPERRWERRCLLGTASLFVFVGSPERLLETTLSLVFSLEGRR